ncbi:hypothetical protein ATY41_01280 [Leifsonia xyli subsp. xyli]|uniref:Uncharacterized protein n=1 Tax=Leifsonia xyli subsp. xyli TaxID=59736 RepID=A0A1E2SNE1_LEIXY|nr:hypothetical protein ATY41_01280 [Leifsonia xyli subsp. xyli]
MISEIGKRLSNRAIWFILEMSSLSRRRFVDPATRCDDWTGRAVEDVRLVRIVEPAFDAVDHDAVVCNVVAEDELRHIDVVQRAGMVVLVVTDRLPGDPVDHRQLHSRRSSPLSTSRPYRRNNVPGQHT